MVTPMRVKARSIGPVATSALHEDVIAHVIAVFDRCFYLQTKDHVVCVADSGLYDGPINLLVSRTNHTPSWSNLGIAVGQRWRMEAGSLEPVSRSRLSINLCSSVRWKPAPLRGDPPRQEHVKAGLVQLKRMLLSRHRPDGLLALVLGRQDSPIGAVEHAAARPLQELGEITLLWLRNGHPGIKTSLHQLIGLGPGLTPSGDDLIAGLLIAARYLGRAEAASTLWSELSPTAINQTNKISFAHLSASGQGFGAAPLHSLLASMIENRDDHMTESLDAVARIGHSSGFDAVAGALILFDAWASLSDRQSAVA